MEQINIEKLRQIELNILLDIDTFCKANCIQYSITGGTLLGAIRHKGFIPWDDDIDIAMTRSNYEKFCKLYKSEKYELITCSKKNYGYMFAKVCDKSTTVIERHNKRVDGLGVFVDVFPIDYLANDYKTALKKVKKIEFLKYLLVAWNWKSFYLNKSKKAIRQIPRFFFFLASRFLTKRYLTRRLNRLIKNGTTNSNYSACYFGSYGNKEVMETSVFSDYISVEFEGCLVMGFRNYDKYLKNIYGDYMKLPPVEKQITHHTFDAYYKK